jgi:predicted membrane protein
MGNTFKKFAETGYSSALKSIKCLIFFQICIDVCFNMYLLYYKITRYAQSQNIEKQQKINKMFGSQKTEDGIAKIG